MAVMSPPMLLRMTAEPAARAERAVERVAEEEPRAAAAAGGSASTRSAVGGEAAAIAGAAGKLAVLPVARKIGADGGGCWPDERPVAGGGGPTASGGMNCAPTPSSNGVPWEVAAMKSIAGFADAGSAELGATTFVAGASMCSGASAEGGSAGSPISIAASGVAGLEEAAAMAT